MRSGVTLATLRNEVLIECGYSTDTAHAAQYTSRINQLLARHQRLLYRQEDWAGLKTDETVTATANTSTFSMPTTISFTDIDSVTVRFADQALIVEYGITPQDRARFASSYRETPIRKWEMKSNGTQFDIWPTGGTAQTLTFTGTKSLAAFASDSDVCTLDGDVLVLRVAAELLARDRKEDAAFKLETATKITRDLVRQQGVLKAASIDLGMPGGRPLRAFIDYIPPGS